MRRCRVGFSILAALLLGAAAMIGGAQAAPQRTAWSTYLRSGPGETYPVLDELEHDSPVTVGGCGPRWCQVSQGAVSGYIDKDALVLPKPASGSAPPGGPQGCFVTDQASYRHPAPTQFCQTQPMAAVHH